MRVSVFEIDAFDTAVLVMLISINHLKMTAAVCGKILDILMPTS